MAQPKLTPEEKVEKKRKAEKLAAYRELYNLSESIKDASHKAMESLNKIVLLAESYQLIFAVDLERYEKTHRKSFNLDSFINRIADNRIASRGEHAIFERQLRRLWICFNEHPCYEDARLELPSMFIFEFGNHKASKQFKEISNGWVDTKILRRNHEVRCGLLIVDVRERFLKWLKEENERTDGKVDIRNYPKQDPHQDIQNIIECLEFPDIAISKTGVMMGEATTMDFYGLKDAIRVMGSVVEVYKKVH